MEKPRCGSKHKEIIKRYEKRLAEGKVREFVIIPRD
jgi:hypothetical protein